MSGGGGGMLWHWTGEWGLGVWGGGEVSFGSGPKSGGNVLGVDRKVCVFIF